MSPSIPIALWNLKVPAGGVKLPGYDDEEGAPLPYRITMAAIDSSTPSTKPSTLKLHRRVVNPIIDSDEEGEDEDEAMEDAESTDEEFVICTLESGKTYQQTLDITMPEDDEIYFSVSGELPIYLSGNYVTPLGENSEDESEYDSEEDFYDLSPDEDELLLEEGDSDFDEDEEEGSDEDELDDLQGRIQEITEEEAKEEAKAQSKGKKRQRDDADEAPQLVDTSAPKADKSAEIDTTGLSKSQIKKLKKQKLNSGDAAAPNGTADRKVQFDKKLEKGPTPSIGDKKEPAKSAMSPQVKPEIKKATLANGVVIQDHKVGSGPKAKNGSKLGIRYIGKLVKNGKEFDQNKKGPPFRFTLGKGEVIKGWDIGLEGIQLGGERKITIPAAMGYGSKNMPGIPANSDLVFEVKCVSLN